MQNIISFEKLGLKFTVNQVAFSIFGMDVYWYGIIIALGMILAFVYASRESKKEGIDQNDFLNLFIISVPAAIIGARIYYCAFTMQYYKDDLTALFNIREGGLAIYGGIIATVLAIFIYSKIKKINPLKILDILAVGLLIGQCIGRWGNFVNCEAYGTETNNIFAMTIMHNGYTVAESVHPTFLYESLWNLLGIIFILIYKKRKLFSGEIFCLYMIWYGFGRMFIEGLRIDSLYIGSHRVSQILSALILIGGIFAVTQGRRIVKARKRAENTEETEENNIEENTDED